MKIFIFTDSHYGRSGLKKKNRYPCRSLGKLKSLEGEIRSCDMAICLGDLTDDGERFECALCLKEISGYMHSVSPLFYSLPGNHDCINFSSKQFRYLGGFIEEAPFIIEHGRSALVFLDTNFLSSGSRYLYTNVDWTDSVLPDNQLSLLKNACDAGYEKIYVFSHQCINADAEERHRVKNFKEIHSVLSSSSSKVSVYQGHYHYGGISVIDGVSYTTLRALCLEDEVPYVILEI